MSEKSFTESFANLKRAADEIGKPATSLEDALKLFEEGMKESEYLLKILDEADQQIEVYENKEK